MKQILHAVHIHAAPSRVYRALTTGADLAGWWTKQVEIDEQVDGVIRCTFAGDFHPEMRQTTLRPDRRVEWRCIRGHANWQDDTFTFGLDERTGETLLMFAQHYAPGLSDEVYGIYNFNWGYLLRRC